MKYREHPAYQELLAQARDIDPKAHVVCAPTRDGRVSATLTMKKATISVRANDLDRALGAVAAAMNEVS